MAERYRDLVRPTLVDVAVPTGAADAAAHLAQTLSSFSRTSDDIAQRLHAQVGARKGAAEGASGAPRFKRGLGSLTAYGQAYNNAALRSYAIRAEADLEETAARLETEAGTDPDKFRIGMEAVRDSILQEAPAEARDIIWQAYEKRMGSGLARIQSALVTELRNEDRTLVAQQVSNLQERIALLRSQDTPEAHAESEEEEAKLFLLIDAAVADGTMSEVEGRTFRDEARRGIVRETVVSRFKNEMENPYGDPIGFIEDLKEINRTAQTLTPEEEAALENELLAELRERNSLRAMRQAQEDAEIEARYAAGDREATTALLAGELTQRGLLERIRDDAITPQTARTLLNELQSAATRPAKSNQRVLFRYETNLLSLTEEEIAAEDELTWEDRSRLILKRREEEQGWKGTQRAREAFDRIDRALGIVPGVSTKLLTEEEARARDMAFTDLYDRIDALPPEEREAAILETAQEVIRSSIRTRAASELERVRQIREEFVQRAGEPEDMSERERRQYDAEISRLDNMIRELEQQRAQ